MKVIKFSNVKFMPFHVVIALLKITSNSFSLITLIVQTYINNCIPCQLLKTGHDKIFSKSHK